jgi:hypothetical protein
MSAMRSKCWGHMGNWMRQFSGVAAGMAGGGSPGGSPRPKDCCVDLGRGNEGVEDSLLNRIGVSQIL